MPDEVGVSQGFGLYESDAWGGETIDEEAWFVSLTWYTIPREVRLLDDEESPRSFIEPDRPPSSVKFDLGGGLKGEVPVDPETGEVSVRDLAGWLFVVGPIVAAVAFLVRRRARRLVDSWTDSEGEGADAGEA